VKPLEALFEAPGLSALGVPSSLRYLYGGEIGLAPSSLYANFVSSLDGVVAIEPLPDSSSIISAGSEADRFVMGLLRAFADAVIIGARTLLAAPGHRWTADHIFPQEAGAFVELRSTLGKDPDPRLIVVTAAGNLDPSHPALVEKPLVLTTVSGADRLRSALPGTAQIEALGREGSLDARAIVDAVRAAGHNMVLCEGGPTLMGQLMSARVVDELFLTLSPVIAGRDNAANRPGFVARAEFPPADLRRARLLSVRRSDSHLFVRYAIAPS
jgi:riboflavin biosynthesis pyrimidine reductase